MSNHSYCSLVNPGARGEDLATDRISNLVHSAEFTLRRWIGARWLRRPAPTAEVLAWIPGAFKFILSYFSEIGMWKWWGLDHEFMWWWRYLPLQELVWLRVWNQCNWSVLADFRGWVVSLFYWLCGDLLEVSSPAKGSRMLGYLGQLPDGQETSVAWEQDGLAWEIVLPMVSTSPPVRWIRSSVGAW